MTNKNTSSDVHGMIDAELRRVPYSINPQSDSKFHGTITEPYGDDPEGKVTKIFSDRVEFRMGSWEKTYVRPHSPDNLPEVMWNEVVSAMNRGEDNGYIPHIN